MKTLRSKSFSPVIFALMMAGGLSPLLSACTSQPKAWSESNVDKRNKVELTRLTHDIDFGVAGQTLSPASAQALEAFLKNANVGHYDELTADIPVGDNGRPSDIDLKRERALAAYLAKRGLSLNPALTPYGTEPKPGSIRLVVSRYVVTLPACPDWSKPAGADYQNKASSNFGCANTSALGQMVANPHDLIEGQAYSGADGTVAAKAVQNYRENKVEQPKLSNNGSGGSSGGGSGGMSSGGN